MGNSTQGIGVYGGSATSVGVHAVGAGANFTNPTVPAAIFAEGGSSIGISVNSTGNFGIFSTTNGVQSIVGESVSNTGVYGSSQSGSGVIGDSDSGIGVTGTSGSGAAIYSHSDFGLGGDFYGDVEVTGILSKGGGSFKIDHPLDPANKYLYHSFVESPDMKNVYDGVVTLDAQGKAVISLPDWFETLNTSFRYQLTAIGTANPNLYVAQQVQKNQFTIAGGHANTEVSWQVTGIRQDPMANARRIPVEQDKAAQEKGSYLYPEYYSQSQEKSVERVRHPQVVRPKAPTREFNAAYLELL